MLRAIALAARLDFTIEPPILDAMGRLRHEIANSSAGAVAGGVLQDPAGGIVGEDLPRARVGRSARTDLRGAPPRRRRVALGVAGDRRRVPAEVHLHAGDAHQRGPAREPARAARPGAAAGPPGARRAGQRATPAPSGPGSGACRSLGATSNGCARSSACSGGCSDLERKRARAARADASQHLPRGADLDGDSRQCAGDRRALDHRAGGARRGGAGCRPPARRRAPPTTPRRRRRRRRRFGVPAQ